MKVVPVGSNFAVCADSTSIQTMQLVHDLTGPVSLIVSDPPYGKVVKAEWDRADDGDVAFARWMVDWTRGWSSTCLVDGGAFYVWGGLGKPGFRPFLRYLADVEVEGEFELANLITWSKKRAYGVQHNYLWTREECAYFVRGPARKPHRFNVPLLDVKRDYSGYNVKYPAKSEYYRRTNVWTDVTEVMRAKVHVAQKAQRVMEIPIEVHTVAGEWVIDPFAGSGTTGLACQKLDRRFVMVEKDEVTFDSMVERLRVNLMNG